MKTPIPQRDRDGALFEPMPGDRETGDGDGDQRFIVEAGVLTPREIEELFKQDTPKETPYP